MKPTHAILLVEDNPADIKITQRALRESDLAVDLIVLRDGQEALDYLLRLGPYADDLSWRSPDLILLDLNLPRLSGQEVLTRIRAEAELNTVPIIVLTTSHRREDVEAVYAAGANTYIHAVRAGVADDPALLAGNGAAADGPRVNPFPALLWTNLLCPTTRGRSGTA